MKGNNHTYFGLRTLEKKTYKNVWKKNVLTVDFMGEKKRKYSKCLFYLSAHEK